MRACFSFIFFFSFVSFSNPCSIIFQLSAKALALCDYQDRVLVKCIAFFVFLNCLWEITFEVIQMTRIFIALAFWRTLYNNGAIVGEAGGIVSSWEINYVVIDINHVAHGNHHCLLCASRNSRTQARARRTCRSARVMWHWSLCVNNRPICTVMV